MCHHCEKKKCKKCKKVDRIVGSWNIGNELFNTTQVYNEGGTSVAQSDVDVGAPNAALPAPPGFRVTISTGNWKKVACNKYDEVNSNILVQQDDTYGNASTPLLRIKKTIGITLVPGVTRDQDELILSVVFTQHALSDVKCVTPLSPPGPPLIATAKRLLY